MYFFLSSLEDMFTGSREQGREEVEGRGGEEEVEGGEGRRERKETDRQTDRQILPYTPRPGIKLATQLCGLTTSLTHNLLVHRQTLQPSHSARAQPGPDQQQSCVACAYESTDQVLKVSTATNYF